MGALVGWGQRPSTTPPPAPSAVPMSSSSASAVTLAYLLCKNFNQAIQTKSVTAARLLQFLILVTSNNADNSHSDDKPSTIDFIGAIKLECCLTSPPYLSTYTFMEHLPLRLFDQPGSFALAFFGERIDFALVKRFDLPRVSSGLTLALSIQYSHLREV